MPEKSRIYEETIGKIGRIKDKIREKQKTLKVYDELSQQRVEQKLSPIQKRIEPGGDGKPARLVRAGISATFRTVGVAAVTLVVIAFIVSEIDTTMPDPENSDLHNATNDTISTTGDALSLGAVAIIIMIAVLMLRLISGIGGGGGGRGR